MAGKTIEDYNRCSAEQSLAYRMTREMLYTFYGGAKGGGKSVGGAKIFQWDISNFRDGRFIVMRKHYNTLHLTTYNTFEEYFPPSLVLTKRSESWGCVNNNEIIFYASDKTKDRNYEKMRGLEATAVMVDEIPEFDEEFYKILPTLLRKDAFHIDTGEPLHKYIFCTGNPVPGRHWLKKHFIDPKTRKLDNHAFIQALPDDNPFLTESYLRDAFSTMDGGLLRMLRYGDWDVEESDLRIITRYDYEDRLIAEQRITDRNPIAGGLDVGLGRPDLTILWLMNQNNQAWIEEELEEYDTMRQFEKISEHCARLKQFRGKLFMDSSSVGKGLFDRLRQEFGGTVQGIEFGGKATNDKYFNMRSQLYFQFRDAVMKKEIEIQSDSLLDEEVDSTFYMPKDGKFIIEPKDKIRERLGRSPDHYDGIVLCWSARIASPKRIFSASTIVDIPSEAEKLLDGYS